MEFPVLCDGGWCVPVAKAKVGGSGGVSDKWVLFLVQPWNYPITLGKVPHLTGPQLPLPLYRVVTFILLLWDLGVKGVTTVLSAAVYALNKIK